MRFFPGTIWNEYEEKYFVMTVDVDGWSSLLNFYNVNHDPEEANLKVKVEEGIERLIGVFRKHKVKATFFVTGEMARKHANIIKSILDNDHELACHGLFHEKNEFVKDLKSQRHSIEVSTRIIEELSGTNPTGFRAPCLRVNDVTFALLSKYGYIYDSSIVSTFIPGYYGYPGAHTKPYPVFNFTKDNNSNNFLEIPVSVNPLIPLPLSAAWMRNLGSFWVKFGVKLNFDFGNPVVFYVHPRDVLDLPRVKGIPWHLYRNVGHSTIKLLEDIFEYVKKNDAKFITAETLAQISIDKFR